MKKLIFLFIMLIGCVQYDYCYRCTIVENGTVRHETWCDVSPEQIQNYIERHNTENEECVCILIK